MTTDCSTPFLVKQQSKRSTIGYWLGDKAHNIWKDSINPYFTNFVDSSWPSLSSFPPKETHATVERKRRLHEDLATLAKGTTIMGRPRRTTPPMYGVIAGQRCAPSSRRPVVNTSPEIGDGALVMMTLSKASFEIRTSASTLPATVAEFYASATPVAAQSFDDEIPDENKPPFRPFEEALDPRVAKGAVGIPEPRFRAKREPFAILHLAEDSSNEKPNLAIVELADASCERETLYETGPPGSGGKRLKGMMRLRAKAPAAIDMSPIIKALELERESNIPETIHDSAVSLDSNASSKIYRVRADMVSGERDIPNAPMMSNVPLPPVSPTVSGPRGTRRPVELASVIPAERLNLPMTPNRQALLDILNGDSSLHGVVKRK